MLYPVVNVIEVMDKNSPDLYRLAPYCRGYDHVFFSLNRYERKKRIEVAIDALAHIKAANPNRNEKIGNVPLPHNEKYHYL